MPRKGAKKAAELAKTSNVASLIDALNFIKIAQSDKGETYHQHCRIIPGFIMAGNGILQAGMKLTDELEACPHTFKFIAALTKCSETVAFTKHENGAIGIKSGPFKVVINCVDSAMLPAIMPDNPVMPLNEEFRKACELVGKVVKDADTRLVCCAVWFTNGSCVGTDSRIMLEYWHGLNLPPYLIPKASIQAILSVNKKFKFIGASENTVTFWFEDDSWIKTNIYAETAPDQNTFFDVPHNQAPIPDKLFEAVDALAPHAENDLIYFNKGEATTIDNQGIDGASYELPQNAYDYALNAKHVEIIKPFVKTLDLSQGSVRIIGFGDNIRIALSGIRRDKDQAKQITNDQAS